MSTTLQIFFFYTNLVTLYKNRTVLRFAFVPREYLGSACTVTLLMFSVLLLETLDFFVPVCVAQIIDLVMYPGVVIPGSPHQNLLDWSSCAA